MSPMIRTLELMREFLLIRIIAVTQPISLIDLGMMSVMAIFANQLRDAYSLPLRD